VPGPREWAGGACIVVACVLSAWVHRQGAARSPPAPEALDIVEEAPESKKKSTRAMV
jgi:hypothetical protein